jgi:hypothetical protein
VSDVRRSPLARPLTVVLAAALVAGTLAGCTGGPFSGGCTPAYQPGDASTAVSVNGEVGDTPAVTMPTPLIATEPERTVTVEGEGEPIPAGATVLASYVYYEGASGASVNESSALYSASDRSLAIGEALVCATAGSRLVVTGPAEQLVADYPGETATLVAVIDIVEVFLGKANGVNQLPLDGMPTVVTAVDGTPGLALGYQAEVVEPRTATIKAGSGAVVADDATVVFHARSFTWSSPTSADAAGGARLGRRHRLVEPRHALRPRTDDRGDGRGSTRRRPGRRQGRLTDSRGHPGCRRCGWRHGVRLRHPRRHRRRVGSRSA